VSRRTVIADSSALDFSWLDETDCLAVNEDLFAEAQLAGKPSIKLPMIRAASSSFSSRNAASTHIVM